MQKKRSLSYRSAGVDIEAGDRFVDEIKPLVRRTFIPGVVGDIGSFGALFRLDLKKYRNPVLVSGTDGVGTKLKIAFLADRHDTVGIDLVAMCVNDIITSGADPLFFLDYFATGRLRPQTAAAVVKGIADGCIESGCALIGGETAEMPGFYARGEYDLSGFVVGAVDRDRIIDGRRVKNGDSIIGLASSGLHSNGYSLARKVFFEARRMSVKTFIHESGCALGEELLKPTRIYVRAVKAVRKKINVKGIAHITGGGIPGNLPRSLRKGYGAVIVERDWPVHPIFDLIRKYGGVSANEMRRTFNMGIGMVLVVEREASEKTMALLKRQGVGAYIIGEVKKGVEGVRYV